MKNLIIIGAGGHGKVAADIAKLQGKWNDIYFFDDNLVSQEVAGLKVLDTFSNFKKYCNEFDFFVAIGNNQTRNLIQTKLKNNGAKVINLIHPDACVASDSSLGEGILIAAGAVINPAATIYDGCIVNTAATIDHDCILNEFVHISPGVHMGGHVIIGTNSWIGLGTNIKNNIFIEKDVIVGAGGLVIKNITKKGVYFGQPVERRFD